MTTNPHIHYNFLPISTPETHVSGLYATLPVGSGILTLGPQVVMRGRYSRAGGSVSLEALRVQSLALPLVFSLLFDCNIFSGFLNFYYFLS